MGMSSSRRKVLVVGATGTIGRATTRALVARGHDVVCLVRQHSSDAGGPAKGAADPSLAGARLHVGDVLDPATLTANWLAAEGFAAIVSCLASRTGTPRDAWTIDHAAHSRILAAARGAGIGQMVLLSAICVQKPLLDFQHAKLAFERELIASGLTYSIVRPTAFFKSLSGQVERVRQGKPFLVFGDGRLTACKPISDRDLADYIADCLDDPGRHNRILPIGGPGPAITPREQGERLFALTGQPPRFRHVPVAFLDVVIGGLSTAGRIVPSLASKAELARIGRYYATQSMLVWNETTGRYDADATPATGSETLFEFYARLVAGDASVALGDHAVF
ncbi:MAG: NAD(P)H-binding protein [Hyphomicrobiaceae bacterium]|nr:NAD(P)H-binding protein [Hyphomicrobiaceae bacterium]